MTPTRKLMLVSGNPLALLERLPGWWRGKAETRMEMARMCLDRGLDKEADEHLRIASEYERRAAAEDLTRRNGA
jgi:hypothetical protein